MTELTPVYTFQGSKWSFTLNRDHTIYLLNSIPKREKINYNGKLNSMKGAWYSAKRAWQIYLSGSVALNREITNMIGGKGKRERVRFTDSAATAEIARMVLWDMERRRRGRKWDLEERRGHFENWSWCRGWKKGGLRTDVAIAIEWS